MKIDLKRVQAMIDNLREEGSDRACAIVAFELLSSLLEQLLRRWMVPEPPKELFEQSGPLGSASAKSYVAFSFGLISVQERSDLHLLRKIRNDFAHDFDHELAFATRKVSDRINALSTPKLLEAIPGFQGVDARLRFEYAFGMLGYALCDLRTRKAEPRPSPAEIHWPEEP